MIVLEIFKIVMQTAVLAFLVLLCCHIAYRAGRNDERDELDQRQQHTRTDAPIPMEHKHGGDLDGP